MPDKQVLNFDDFQPCFGPIQPCSAGDGGSNRNTGFGLMSDADLPRDFPSYPHEESRVYDLSMSAAASASLPVFSTSGGASRRVVVLERIRYQNRQRPDGSVAQFGYAIRLLLTVSKLDGKLSLNLPILTASAQLNQIEAKWQLQVHGLTSQSISKAILPPADLNVETFVNAKRSMEDVIDAIHAPDTQFTPVLVALRPPESTVTQHAAEALGRTAALDSIKEGRSLIWMEEKLISMPREVQDAAVDMYKAVAGTLNPAQAPGNDARRLARELLHGADMRI